MTSAKRLFFLLLTIVAIVTAIIYLELQKPAQLAPGETDIQTADLSGRAAQKARKYSPAKEISTPDGFINSEEFKMADLIGEKVILVDFWTYSCINCQRTTPFLNEWYEKYKDYGLEIVGIHTPEFEFEKDFNNVAAATRELGIKFPVVLDMDYSTWRAYENRYWPRKYLIDIDGFIVYDHIGEGGYEETELKIREALQERATLKNLEIEFDLVELTGGDTSISAENIGSPEIYFGSARNDRLGNGFGGLQGEQTLSAPTEPESNILYLDGDWLFDPEFARNTSADANIVFKFSAKDVYMVLGATESVEIEVRLDGQAISDDLAGTDVIGGEMTVDEERLYHLISLDDYGGHVLELIIRQPGLEAFTFTFG